MSPPLVCLALALLVAPASVTRRRFDGLFAVSAIVRKPGSSLVFRLGCVGGAGAVLMVGPGQFIAVAMVILTAVVRYRRAERDRRRGTECGYLLDALEAVIGELRVGAHPSAAAGNAARESKGDAALALAVSSARGRLGGCASEGLRKADSIVAAELSRIADAWLVAERHGLALAELLAAARADLVGRMRFHGRTAATLAGARASASVLAGLPLLGIVLGQLMGASPLPVLFTSAAGTILLPLGVAFVCAGLLWTDAITRKVVA
ncbi:type II secretion system F family protein [Nocardia callitridis]|uniref:Type II secretion system F family protein n=1 Tax=Nocardia callitridis TaxID=648753 RepID=A0ABP9K2E5_9NOCA